MVDSDCLSGAGVARYLRTRFVGQRLVYYPQSGSTNDLARQEARRGAAEGLVVLTEEQTAGRGRIRRAWLTPKGNIALSIVLYPNTAQLPYLIMLASLSVVHAVKEATGLEAGVKWPNDVLIGGKKICGILIENDVRGESVCSVTGIGINVRLSESAQPELAAATSLMAEAGGPVSRNLVVASLLNSIERLYLLLREDPLSVYSEWRKHLVTLGKRVIVRSGEEVLEGIAESVDTDGSLLLRGADGGLTRVVSGDLTLREAV